jgi:hypothetical protein
MLTHQHLFSVMLAHATTLDDVYFHFLPLVSQEINKRRQKGRTHDVNLPNLNKQNE